MHTNSTNDIEASETLPAKNKGRFRRWFWGVTVVLIALTFLAIGRQFRSIGLLISKETTYFTAPLKSDGKSIDLLKAYESNFYSKKIASDENGYRFLIERLGASDSDPRYVADLFEKLDLDATKIDAPTTFEEPLTWLTEYAALGKCDIEKIRMMDAKNNGMLPTDDEYAAKIYDELECAFVLDSRASSPWNMDDLPMLKVWLEESGNTLDLLGEAVRKPNFEVPFVRLDENKTLISLLFFEGPRLRGFARALQCRANYRIGTGDFDGAIDDVMTCKRLGRHLQNQFNVIDRLTGVAIEGIADAIRVFDVRTSQCTKEQILRLVRETNMLPARRSLDRILFFERLVFLDLIDLYSSRGYDGYDENVKTMIKLGIDWNTVAKRINQKFDNPSELLGVDEENSEYGFNEFLSIYRRSVYCADLICDFSVQPYIDAAHRLVCQNQLKAITMAMLLYEKDHGTLPPAFSANSKGSPLHSWRVLLLPYLGQQELYDQLNLEEPWDSLHNRKFWSVDVPFYRCPSDDDASAGETNYSVVIGEQLAFEGEKGARLDTLDRGRGRLILVVERREAVCWMNPSNEITYSKAKLGINSRLAPLDGIGSDHWNGANMGLRSGRATFFADQTESKDLGEMLKGTYRRNAN